MERDTIAKQIAELTERIHQLPKGYISQKTISGFPQFSFQLANVDHERYR